MSPHYKQLRTKIIAVTLSFSLIPAFVLGITIYYQFSSAYQTKILESLRTLAQNRRSAIELFFEERIAQLVAVANQHSFGQLSDERRLNQVFTTMQMRSKPYTDIGVIDQEGNHCAYVGPYYSVVKNANYAGEHWFASVMSSGLFVSDVFLGRRNVPHIVIAVRRIEENKSWILRATLNSDIIEELVQAGQVGKLGDSYIVNRRNMLQTSPRNSGNLLGIPAGPDLSSTSATTVERMNFKGEAFFFASTPLTTTKWVLVIKEDPSEEMTPLFEARYLEGIILALGCVVVIVGTLFTTRSMTNELMRMEQHKSASDEAVVQSAKMAALGKMAAGVAHEINNPLQIIGDQAGWMKDLLQEEDMRGGPNYEEFEGCIKKIERNLARCRSITHRMLRFGRRMEPALEPVDVNEVLAETITFLENEARYREIEIHTGFGETMPRINSDRSQLQQVFLNIVDNALDAVGKSGFIRITTSHDPGDPGEIVIHIEDNGPGIPKDMLKKVFDPFFTTKAANEGTGLGLSISYSIIEKLGGQLSVASEHGKGSVFSIRLPAR
ncbi:MAG: ATP-binding protein [Pseudomonadota bacterium]